MLAGCKHPEGGGQSAGAARAGGPTPRHANRLAGEKSPYLLQHAHNPVDWYPWGEEAFAKAKAENKPIFLSIGYSTCHWCHVMERESFEDPRIAKLLNDYFVPVKVDREERPDVDRVYMTYVQAATGSGGWPLTVFLTPDLQPFLGGTYFPPEERYGMPALPDVLMKVRDAWRKDRDGLQAAARETTGELRKALAVAPHEGPPAGEEAMDAAYEQLHSSFDADHGGFGAAPKFPQPVVLHFLLRYDARTARSGVRDMVLRTLVAMAEGGIHDPLGGGFHRYSTDERWFLPHFEKMLYDQAQLASAYLDAYQVTHEASLADSARDILDYVLREMTGPEGQFYSAQDADSAIDAGHPQEKAEGRFYVWTAGEIERVLGRDSAAIFEYRYCVEPRGNVAQDPHNEFAGRNVLFAARSIEQTARQFGLSPAQARVELASARGKLLKARGERPAPQLDDKTVVAWNGLMISAFARGGAILEEPRYQQAATKAADVIRRKLYVSSTGTLYRRLRGGEAKVEAFLEDYAMLIQGLLDLYESTFDVGWLKLAAELQSRQDERFWDESAGGYFTTTGRDGSILLRVKDASDGAEPSGNAVAVMNLLRLSAMRADEEAGRKADRTLQLFAPQMRQAPSAMPQMLSAVDFRSGRPVQIVLAGGADGADTRSLLREIRAHFIPNKIVLLADGGEGQGFLAQTAPFLKTVGPMDGKAAAYVCRNFTCHLPTTEVAVLRRLLMGDKAEGPAPAAAPH